MYFNSLQSLSFAPTESPLKQEQEQKHTELDPMLDIPKLTHNLNTRCSSVNRGFVWFRCQGCTGNHRPDSDKEHGRGVLHCGLLGGSCTPRRPSDANTWGPTPYTPCGRGPRTSACWRSSTWSPCLQACAGRPRTRSDLPLNCRRPQRCLAATGQRLPQYKRCRRGSASCAVVPSAVHWFSHARLLHGHGLAAIPRPYAVEHCARNTAIFEPSATNRKTFPRNSRETPRTKLRCCPSKNATLSFFSLSSHPRHPVAIHRSRRSFLEDLAKGSLVVGR